LLKITILYLAKVLRNMWRTKYPLTELPNSMVLIRYLFTNPYHTNPTTLQLLKQNLHEFTNQCCGSETFYYGSGSDFSMSSGSRPDFEKVPDPVSDLIFFLKKYRNVPIIRRAVLVDPVPFDQIRPLKKTGSVIFKLYICPITGTLQ
jgi:hypothetical protein